MAGYPTNGLPAVVVPFTGFEKVALDTQLASGIAPQTEAANLTNLAGYFGGNLPMVTGRFYGVTNGSTQAAVLTVASTLYAYPVYIPNQITVATLNIGCTTGQTAGACHVGIYADNGAGYPGALVYDTGAVSGLTTTVVVTKTPSAATAPTLQAGWYWFASSFFASGTYPSVTGTTAIYGSSLNAQLGSDTAAHALTVSGEAATGISVATTYGALPATFTAAATVTLNATTPIFVIGV